MAAQLEELIVEREQAAQERDRRSRVRTTTALVVVAIIAIVGVVLSALANRFEANRTEDVTAALAEPVAQRVLADGRKESAEAARGVLRSANSRLIANRLPVVPEPPVDALSVLVQLQANRAQLLADLGTVDFIAEGLRDRFGASGTFPASFLDRFPPPAIDPTATPPDGVVEVLPGDDGPSVVIEPPQDTGGGAGGGTTNSREPRTPAPAPAPAPRRPTGRPTPARPAPAAPPTPAPNRDRGLCLLGVVLCTS